MFVVIIFQIPFHAHGGADDEIRIRLGLRVHRGCTVLRRVLRTYTYARGGRALRALRACVRVTHVTRVRPGPRFPFPFPFPFRWIDCAADQSINQSVSPSVPQSVSREPLSSFFYPFFNPFFNPFFVPRVFIWFVNRRFGIYSLFYTRPAGRGPPVDRLSTTLRYVRSGTFFSLPLPLPLPRPDPTRPDPTRGGGSNSDERTNERRDVGRDGRTNETEPKRSASYRPTDDDVHVYVDDDVCVRDGDEGDDATVDGFDERWTTTNDEDDDGADPGVF